MKRAVAVAVLMGCRAYDGGVLTEKHVATTGNDTTGDGSLATPWATIGKALSTAMSIAGNYRVLVHGGTYTENVSSTGTLYLTRTFTNPVYVQAVSGQTVVIRGTGAGLGAVQIGSGAANVIFCDCTIQNNTSTNTVLALNNATAIVNISFRRCIITNDATNGVGVNHVHSQTDNCAFLNCTVTATGTGSTGMRFEGKSGSSLYVSGLALTNCIVTGVAKGLHFGGFGWVRNVTITGGVYTATATTGTAGIYNEPGGVVANITLTGVSVRGNSICGMDIGGAASPNTVSGLALTNCDIDMSASTNTNGSVGLYFRDYVSSVLIDGGRYIGGASLGALAGYGGIGSVGPHNTNFEIRNITHAEALNTVLAIGIGGVGGTGITTTGGESVGLWIHHNVCAGTNCRAITLQDNITNAVIEYNDTTVKYYSIRIGHDSEASAYTCSNIIIRNNTLRSTTTCALLVARGVASVDIHDNIIQGGLEGALRLRGDATNTVRIHDNTIGLYSGRDAGAITGMITYIDPGNLELDTNEITGDGSGPIFACYTVEAGLTASVYNTHDNAVVQPGGTIYSLPAAFMGASMLFNAQAFTLSGGATFGNILGATCADLTAARAAWAGYGAGTNDGTSTV